MLLFITSGQTEKCESIRQNTYQKSYPDDPALTFDGEVQAQQTGDYVKKLLDDHMNAQEIKEKDLKLIFMSSPALACVQTAANIAAQLPSKPKIYIQTELSDFMLPHIYKTEMGEDQYQIFSVGSTLGDIQKKLKIHVILDKHLKSQKLFEPKYPENLNYIRARVGSFIVELMDLIKNQLKMDNVFVCVTHEGVEEIVIDHFNGKCKQISECAITQVLMSRDSNDGKLGLKAQSFCKK